MSVFLGVNVASFGSHQSSGFFLPEAFSGKIDRLVPNSGLLIMEGENGYKSLGKVGVFPVENVKGKIFNVPIKTLIASSRGELLERFFPAMKEIHENDLSDVVGTQRVEQAKKFKSPDQLFFSVPKLALDPINMVRESLLRLVNVEGVQEYCHRNLTVETRWNDKNLLIVYTQSSLTGLNADLIDLSKRFFVPTPQRVRIIFISDEKEISASDVRSFYLATDTPNEMEKYFHGQGVSTLSGEDAEMIKMEGNLPQNCFLYRIEGAHCKIGFYTAKKYKERVSLQRKLEMDDFLSQL